MKFIITSLALSWVFYYLQIMWLAWIFLVMAGALLVTEIFCRLFCRMAIQKN